MNLPIPTDSALAGFHPAVSAWFSSTFPTVTAAQARAWPLIHQHRSTLVAAPTGSGKTLTAFLAVIDDLVHRAMANGGHLPDETLVVYVSPLKALSNDIQINLQDPLAGITEQLRAMGLPQLQINTAVRTGDTPQKDRSAMRKTAPHILVTTPESLYVLLGSDSGRQMLSTARTVIVDEIHAIAASKRGSHLALSLERLQALCAEPLMRIGLSATQKPIEAVSQFLVGCDRACEIIDIGHARPRDLDIEVPPVPLSAVMANDVWELVYDRLAALAREHRTTLIFVNTRRLAERLSRHLSERLGKEAVAAHHGSLAKEFRLDAEQRLKRGELQVLIATASLELGIDIGDVDLVCQIASPRSIAGFLQRVGRSGHQVGGTPKGRLFATTRDDLIECAALLDCVRRGELDTLLIPKAPLDVLAQQIIAEVSCQEWQEQALLEMFRNASPYSELDEKHYQALLQMLAEGYNGRVGIRSAYLHRDAVTRTLRGRRGAKLTAVTSGGTIPDNADYSVLLEPQGLNIGSVNEDFAVESIAGDVFQLGNTSYRILRVETGKVRVEDAQGQPPTIPFWLGEAPGRSAELSFAVARLQAQLDELLGATPGHLQPAIDWLTNTLGLNLASAEQLVDYLARARLTLGALPSQDTLLMERFFDESGGTQLIIHTPFGSRINRAWGLALRKRFCRTFNFELQAAASEDAIVLSLSTSHSFELDDVWRYLHSNSAEHTLIQAVLDAPLFGVRWRWNAGVALFEGYPAAASAWDSDILPARIKDYSASWLDDLCRSGKLVWTRLTARNKSASTALRSTPILLLPRSQVGLWSGLTEQTPVSELSPKTQKVYEALSQHGALFFDELTHEAHLLRSELEIALQELVGAGLVNADSFAGLRALITPASKRQNRSSRRGRGAFVGGMDDAGRWALLRRGAQAPVVDNKRPAPTPTDTLEHIAMTLLRRYGVVFWRLLEREADWLPSWRELLRTFHRLEARGEIRGGRFVSGLAGEQFALPEAIPLLREVRRRPHDGSLIAVCGVDPLNLAGTLLPGAKVPALASNRLVYRDGLPAAAEIAGKQIFWLELDQQSTAELHNKLIRH
ncbi:DEAD/DEAH box helicase [Pseudomonas rossensis]|uniref:DEAD/DEAH box helicase n=1 Tax=Pseudomonas rossensis TaxID=2305471 RepID=UPI00326193D9